MRDTTDPSSFLKMNGVALRLEATHTRWKCSSTNTTALSEQSGEMMFFGREWIFGLDFVKKKGGAFIFLGSPVPLV